MAADPTTPGKETSEWKAWLIAVCAILSLAGGYMLTTGLIVDTEGFGAFEAITLAVTVLGGISGVTFGAAKYGDQRTKLKINQLVAEASKAASEAGKPADPT